MKNSFKKHLVLAGIVLLGLISCSRSHESDESEKLKAKGRKIESIGKEKLSEFIHDILANDSTNWVLYENGTLVMLDSIESNENFKDIANEILRDNGPKDSDSDAVGFQLYPVQKGWMVGFKHRKIFAFVNRLEMSGNASNTDIGKRGIWRCIQDRKNLKILHIHKNWEKH